MMFWTLLLISILGFGYAGYKDLRTTEFPDWLPYGIIVSAMGVRAVFSYIYSDWWIVLSSLLIGGAFLVLGLMLYHARQWGDGDAWLLGSLGFLYPGTSGLPEIVVPMMPFPLVLLFNFFLVSFFYLVVYSIALGVRNKGAARKFFRELRGDFRSIKIVTVAFTAACLALGTFLVVNSMVPVLFVLNILVFPVLLFSLLVFVRYGRFVEANLFKKRVYVKDLRVGDVPVDSKWKVMTEKELAKLKRKGGKMWIKEGVRLAPVFLITVLVTLFCGNFLFLLLF